MILICIDKDGTINLDENYYLGSKSHWKEQVSFLPGVVEGIKLLNTIVASKIAIITNQSGVALGGADFELLDEARAHEVNKHIIAELAKLGARIDGYQVCPYVTAEYARKAKGKGRIINEKYIKDDARCMKPNIGMLEDAAKMFGSKLEDVAQKFVIGDRATDIETGQRGGCISIFVESMKTKELGDVAKVLDMQKSAPAGNIAAVSDFLAAAATIEQMCSHKKILS